MFNIRALVLCTIDDVYTITKKLNIINVQNFLERSRSQSSKLKSKKVEH